MEREVLKYEKLRPRKQSNESARVPKKERKTFFKKLKKVVDKRNHLRYTNKAVARERRARKKSAAARHLENYIVQKNKQASNRTVREVLEDRNAMTMRNQAKKVSKEARASIRD